MIRIMSISEHLLPHTEINVKKFQHIYTWNTSSLPSIQCHCIHYSNLFVILFLSFLDDHGDIIRDWERDDETFVETRASAHVMSWLSKCNIAVLTGSSGTGKSFLIHHVALELHRQKK